MATDAETIAALQVELAEYKSGDLAGAIRQRNQCREQLREALEQNQRLLEMSKPSASWVDSAKSLLTYLANNKAALVAVLAFAGVVYHHFFPSSPPLDTAKIQAVVDKSIEARPPVIVVPAKVDPDGKVKTNVPGLGEGGKPK